MDIVKNPMTYSLLPSTDEQSLVFAIPFSLHIYIMSPTNGWKRAGPIASSPVSTFLPTPAKSRATDYGNRFCREDTQTYNAATSSPPPHVLVPATL
jgi:hypothetical protein